MNILLQIIKSFLLVLIFFHISISETLFNYDYKTLKHIQNLEICKYTKNYYKGKYIFCRHKFVKCGIRDKLSYYKYKEKIDFFTGIYFHDVKNIEKTKIYVKNLVTCESGWNPILVSIDYGYGLFQLTNSKKCLDIDCNANAGLKHLKYMYNIANKKSYVKKYCAYNRFYCDDIIQYYTLRFYNGGTKQINKVEKHFEYNENFLSIFAFYTCYKQAAKISGRFICFEKVNSIYPLKIMLFKNLTK